MIKITVGKCIDCPFVKEAHPDDWYAYYCDFLFESKFTYEDASNESPPEDCPLRKEPIFIDLDSEVLGVHHEF